VGTGLFLFGERLIIHSAHQFDTSKEAFNRILMLIENAPDLDKEVARVSRSHGEEGVELLRGTTENMGHALMKQADFLLDVSTSPNPKR